MTRLKYIQPIKLAEMVGDENVVEMLQSYQDSLAASRQELTRYRHLHETESMRMVAHKMKSSTRFIGADELADCFMRLEQQARENETDIYADHALFEQLHLGIENVEQEIERYILDNQSTKEE